VITRTRFFEIIVLAAATISLARVGEKSGSVLPDPPEVRGRNHVVTLTLRAVTNAEGHDAFSFNGKASAPVIRAWPGDTLKIEYINELPKIANEPCAIEPCRNMTNLHFHGLEVSPHGPQDDVLDMMAMPGDTLHYFVKIPPDHSPGLFWYHTHPHGESHRQALDGMSGAIVIEGMDRYLPELRNLREQVLVLRGESIEHARDATPLLRRVEAQAPSCGSERGETDRIFTVNAQFRPTIGINPGERQFWRIVNASADRYVDLQLEGQMFEIVAMDGEPIAHHDPHHRTRIAGHVLLPPAGRLEAIVTGPSAGTPRRLITRCVDTGPDGDPNPAMVLADIVPRSGADSPPKTPKSSLKPDIRTLDLAAEEKAPPRFIVTFTEDKNGFYINGEKFAPDAAPMVRAKIGAYQHWKIVNATGELHPMHIHQVHFLAYAENGRPIADPLWLDTVNVAYGGSVDVIMDFTNPVIRGMSVFHCHLLNHEDKGMMAKILFE
jgi:FtsP/CotA-like multicopper oxidase with cupredoxin domain